MSENKELVLLNEKASTRDLVKVESHEKIVADIEGYLAEDRFNYVVTNDNLAQVKKDNADLNKTKKVLSDTAKVIINKESETINSFKANVKSYVEMIENKRVARNEDVATFENKTKKLILELCEEYVSENTKSIRPEFMKVSIGDMDKLSYATSTGKLSKSAKDVLDGRISECLNKQMKYDLRVSNLANLCYQNGLEAPLTEQHIQGIVFIDDDNIYADKVAKLINDEIERFARIKESERLKAEREAKVTAEKEAREKLLAEKRGLENKFRPVIEGSDLSSIDAIISEIKLIGDDFLNADLLSLANRKKVALIEAEKVIVDTPPKVEVKGLPDMKKPIVDSPPNFETPFDYEKEIVTIACTLQFRVKKGADKDKIVVKVKEKLFDAGLGSSVIDVVVER